MKTMLKRILPLMLVLSMVLSCAPVLGLASINTVYFDNTDNWSTVNIYYWSSENTQYVIWPGVAMTLDSGTVYSFDLPADVEYVIFNNGSTQTNDLTLPSDQNLYTYSTGQWSSYVGAHTWGDLEVITEATCTTAGEGRYTCSDCGATKSVKIDPLGHDFSTGNCSRCGQKQIAFFFDNNGSGWSTPYIYAWSGSNEHCGSWPGAKMTAVSDVPGLFCAYLSEPAENVIFNSGSGNQTADLIVPTDGSNLYTYATSSWSKYDTCSHSWDEGTVTTAATCTTDGVMTYECTLCGETTTEVISAPGHSFVNGSCENCGAVESCVNHVWDEGTVTKENSCWLTGIRTYTCTLCGETKEEIIYAGHDIYVAQVIEPTCTTTGKEIKKCTRCAYSMDRTLPKIDHSYVPGEVVPPTCTEDGYTVCTCSFCGAVSHGELVYHTGHKWSGNNCLNCGKVCVHTYVDGICTSCDKGGPAYVEGYYEIENAAQLYWFARLVNSGTNDINGKLIADIDLNGGTWTSIGYYLSDTLSPDTVPYTGIFDGQGHTVSNFTTAGTDNEGLFGYCSSATISNLGVINANVTGWRAGAVAGYALTSNVTNCFAKDCTITGKTTNSVAMLSGTVYIAPVASPQGGIIRNCYAMNCTLKGDTDLAVYATPVGGTDTQNGYYYNISYSKDFDSVRNSTEVTMDQLTSGEVTYLLNKGVTDGTQGWYQTCGTGLPAHSGQTVYQVTGCGAVTSSYSNDPNAGADHNYQAVVTAPTCLVAGFTTYTCSVCGDSYTGDVVAATGHNYQSEVTAPTCTDGGYTTYTCSGCGNKYTADYVDATGHSFVEGSCSICGENDPDYIKPVVQPTITLKYPTLTFEDVILMNVYFSASDLEDVVEMGLVTYTQSVDEASVDTANAVVPGYIWSDADQLYYATTNGIAAKDLGDMLHFAVYAKLTDGTYYYTRVVSYSPRTYAYSSLTTGSDSMKPIVVAMLNYGAAAQTYFNYKTDALVNADLTADQIALVESYRSDMIATVAAASTEKQGTLVSNGGFSRRYPTVSFEGAFCINYYCVPSEVPVDGITMYYWDQAAFDANDVLNIDNATAAIPMVLDESTGEYHAAVEGIAAKDLDKGVYVAFVYADGTTTYSSGILAYSIGTYCSVQASGTGATADLAKATAVYGYYANALFN